MRRLGSGRVRGRALPGLVYPIDRARAAAGNKVFDLLTEFAVVEQDHATFLRSALSQTSGPVIFPGPPTTSAKSPVPPQRGTFWNWCCRWKPQAYGRISEPSRSSRLAVSTCRDRPAAIQGTEARHTSVLTIARNQLYATTSDVAPINPDNKTSGTFPISAFRYETYVPSGYNPLKPNEGVIGIDANLSPDTVLAAVGPFFAAPVGA